MKWCFSFPFTEGGSEHQQVVRFKSAKCKPHKDWCLGAVEGSHMKFGCSLQSSKLAIVKQGGVLQAWRISMLPGAGLQIGNSFGLCWLRSLPQALTPSLALHASLWQHRGAVELAASPQLPNISLIHISAEEKLIVPLRSMFRPDSDCEVAPGPFPPYLKFPEN